MPRLAFLFVLIFLAFSVPAKAQTEKVLYDFGSSPTDGYEPSAPLLMDGWGNLFGTTSAGDTSGLCPDPSGPNACGTVFELVNSSGKYTEKILYNFSGPPDGDVPMAGLIMDSSGNLYGTTGYGGSGLCGDTTCGTVFELVKSASGYTETVLYSFTGYDGAFPLAGLIMDSSGNLYGTTSGGGTNGDGTVFELVNSSGSYALKILYSFGPSATDGIQPLGGVIMDSAGNLFGTTVSDRGPYSCGLVSCGTVFELVNSSSGYTEKILYTFTDSSGANPRAGLIMDSSGNLYGTTSSEGAYGSGTVFELTNSSGSYVIGVLHNFGATRSDGVNPIASLLMDRFGDLFGTTSKGGSQTACDHYGCGTVFELYYSSGTYTEEVLHRFGNVGDGESPAAALIMDSPGNLYSTTQVGGNSLELGTAFEVTGIQPVKLTPTTLAFGNVVVGTTSVAKSVTVKNASPVTLMINSISITGADPGSYNLTNNCGGILESEKSCTLTLTFSPASSGRLDASITLDDSASDSPQTVSITGTGVAPVTVTPSSLVFANQNLGTTSAAKTVTLKNEQSTSLTDIGISFSGPNGGDFSNTTTCTSVLAAGKTCTISVKFTPSAAGAESATLVITDSASDSPQQVQLSGTGVIR